MRPWFDSRRLFAFLSLALAGFALASCDPAELNDGPPSGCGAGTAAIGITDGMIAPLCGCSGVVEGWQVFGGAFNCTVSASTTTVSFYYLSTRNSHQILSNGGVGFVSSPVSDPTSSNPVRVHAVTLTTGAYTFSDAFDSRLQATITVP